MSRQKKSPIFHPFSLTNSTKTWFLDMHIAAQQLVLYNHPNLDNHGMYALGIIISSAYILTVGIVHICTMYRCGRHEYVESIDSTSRTVSCTRICVQDTVRDVMGCAHESVFVYVPSRIDEHTSRYM